MSLGRADNIRPLCLIQKPFYVGYLSKLECLTIANISNIMSVGRAEAYPRASHLKGASLG
jgi:hypothetical protein